MNVVDTDVCVDALRGKVAALDALAALEQEGPLCMAAITAHELWQGVAGVRSPVEAAAALERFLEAFEILPYDGATARAGGRLAGDLARAGRSIGDLDTMIAATALAHGATLVTRNARHFKRVRDLRVHGV